MDRFHTHIVMVSGQPTPNVLPVMDKSIRPSEVILCTTDDMRRNAEILAAYFSRHQISARFHELGSAYDFAALQEKFLDCLYSILVHMLFQFHCQLSLYNKYFLGSYSDLRCSR